MPGGPPYGLEKCEQHHGQTPNCIIDDAMVRRKACLEPRGASAHLHVVDDTHKDPDTDVDTTNKKTKQCPLLASTGPCLHDIRGLEILPSGGPDFRINTIAFLLSNSSNSKYCMCVFRNLTTKEIGPPGGTVCGGSLIAKRGSHA